MRHTPEIAPTASHHHRALGRLGLVASALAIAACGTSSRPHTKTSYSYDANVKIADCMRAHRVSNFADPSASVAGEGGGGFSIQYEVNGSSELMVNGVSVGGPAYPAAARTCGLSAGHPAPVSEAQKQGMIAKAHCIRTHGVPNFPDPFFGATGGIGFRRPAGYNIQAPAFQHAKAACANVGLAIPGAGVG
jgi:hypothetical protein